ncbi:MAG: hypothetical protein PHR77_22405 [Kiritimatiellae bacterium]|nr:hypothetical protein [Kiritimatiellia bacterium]MDD5522034.1 hypothetical protein [Kiritimatiellia bacterium]
MKKVLITTGFVNMLALWQPVLHVLRTICLTFFFAWACTRVIRANPDIVLGDYDAEPRIGGHVDTDRLIRRLGDLGANTYMWLVWHSTNDWEDLKIFLPKAKQVGITVWVYLVPHSETALQDKRWPYSEPFRLDYIRWAEEIARLSLRNPNLTGYVIDDFWSNVRTNRFSPDYIRSMTTAGKAINPRLKFYPLMYYHEIAERSVEILAPLIDGVVAAYPPDRAAVERALTFLEDRYRLPSEATIVFPWNISSRPGHHGLLIQEAQVTDGKIAQLGFHYRDDYDGPTTGYHRLQVSVDDQVVWDEDTAGHDNSDVTVDLAKVVNGKRTVKLKLGVLDAKGVGNFGIEASFAHLTVRGLELKDTELGHGTAWSQDIAGPFAVQFRDERVGTKRFRLPLIVMPAGQAGEYKMRYHEEGTPENIAGRIKMVMDLVQNRQVQGIVTYCLDKNDGSASFEAVRKVFDSVRKLAR